jgi:hypothetical protein
MRQLVDDIISKGTLLVLTLVPAVFDWIRLGVFTGSRACEYAQTGSAQGKYSTVPNTPATGALAGLPIAFIRSDFTFFDKDMIRLEATVYMLLHESHLIMEIHICYCFDKSGKTFVIKKYSRTNHFICPVEAAVSIFLRAHLLGVPDRQPLGAFRRNTSEPFTFITSDDIISVMRDVCRRAYPDPNHYYRLNIHCIVSHSNRVTAAVALRAAGKDNEHIAHRLRWELESVKHYLRECMTLTEELTKASFKGIFMI